MNTPTSLSDLSHLRDLMRDFTNERDWDQFHAPKNLAIAICVEAAELLEPFQWLPTGCLDEITPRMSAAAKAEMADVLLYLVRLADKMDIDLYQAAVEKIQANRLKYPADLVRGDSRKYTEYKG